MSRIRPQGGFTIVEMMLYITVISIITAAIFTALSTSTRFWQKGSSRYDIQQTAGLIANRITHDLQYGADYQILQSYSNANANEAIQYKTLLNDTNSSYIYYIDKNDRHLYRIPGFNTTNAELIPGQSVAAFKNIKITAPPGEQIFSRDASAPIVNIAIVVTDTAQNQSITVRTSVSSLSQFFQ